MSIEQSQYDALKQMYQRKFYRGSKVRGALQKVLNLQKKLKQFKEGKDNMRKNGQQTSILVLDDDTNQFRPSTHMNYYRQKREKYNRSSEGRRIDGFSAGELQVVLEKKSNGEICVLRESLKDGNFVALHQHTKRMRMHNSKSNTKQQKVATQFQLSRFDMPNPISQRNAVTSQRKFRIDRPKKQQRIFFKQNEQTEKQKQKQKFFVDNTRKISKKVFIGGRDLQKAAEQYNRDYQQMNRNMKESMTQRQAQAKTQAQPQRIITSHTRMSKRKTPTLQRLAVKMTKKDSRKSHKKLAKFQDMVMNLDLDPWNANYPDQS